METWEDAAQSRPLGDISELNSQCWTTPYYVEKVRQSKCGVKDGEWELDES